MKTENVTLNEEEALELAIDELESTLGNASMEEIGSMLGWNDWVVYIVCLMGRLRREFIGTTSYTDLAQRT